MGTHVGAMGIDHMSNAKVISIRHELATNGNDRLDLAI